jgi:deoxyribodipyrimidine photo-lyase
MEKKRLSIFWFRRDLRLNDNCGLFHALSQGKNVIGLFIFDTNILDKLVDKDDARVTFLYDQLNALKKSILDRGGTLWVKHGEPLEIWRNLTNNNEIAYVFTNRDYEPYAIGRDQDIASYLASKGIPFKSYKDHVLYEMDEVVKPDRKPYTVYTPYAKVWRQKAILDEESGNSPFQHYPSESFTNEWMKGGKSEMPELEKIGFRRSSLNIPTMEVPKSLIRSYSENRDIPGIQGTSRLGIHFRFGTISIREKANIARSLSPVYLSELIWRDFYATILFHFPHVQHKAFKPAYDNILWRNNEEEFEKWCAGQTGYPIVDAGMRELENTGFMHNRVRMVVASFLTKHLLIDWRWGEAWFARKLLDFDLASNNGGWQWAAGCGTDAAPYFRIFNPTAQQEKFDPKFVYVKKWVPELSTPQYPKPIVDHKEARNRCLTTYKNGLAVSN